MDEKEKEEFKKFLELPEIERLELIMGDKLHWWQKLYIRWVNRWWTNMLKANPRMDAFLIWESIHKGRI